MFLKNTFLEAFNCDLGNTAFLKNFHFCFLQKIFFIIQQFWMAKELNYGNFTALFMPRTKLKQMNLLKNL